MSRYSTASMGRTSILNRSSTFEPRRSNFGRSSLVYVPKSRSSNTLKIATAYESMTYSGTLSWETAFTDVVAVLKIQYRHDSDVSSFLNDSDKVRLLTYSSIARMELGFGGSINC